MRLETVSKFYEIITIKNKVYVFYGRLEKKIPQKLPYGKIEEYIFDTPKLATEFYKKKVDEKIKEYLPMYIKEHIDLMWMVKHGKLLVKDMQKTPKKVKSSKKKCPKGKVLNQKTNRCILDRSRKKKSTPTQPPFKKIVLKKGELGKHGYKDIKSLKVRKRRKSLNNAITEYGAPKILKKVGLLKTFQKNKSPEVSKLLMDNMKWMRKKYDTQFKSSWKNSLSYI
jgi:hypothetical protein